VQVDVADLSALRCALQSITAAHGDIRSILHTAAVVSDAAIDSITVDAFSRVLRPKVFGAYNLHLLAEELALDLSSFVLLSSIRYRVFFRC
jgi:NAD(P)-dependent dehydrogenase (short-subunit alcohol dehydrogenase family)